MKLHRHRERLSAAAFMAGLHLAVGDPVAAVGYILAIEALAGGASA